jgi:hypothetical protein
VDDIFCVPLELDGDISELVPAHIEDRDVASLNRE